MITTNPIIPWQGAALLLVTYWVCFVPQAPENTVETEVINEA
jgi:hypothetical protein